MPEKTPHPHFIDGAPPVAGEVKVLSPEEQARAEYAKALGELHEITGAIGAEVPGDVRVDSVVADYVQEGLLHCGDDTACTKKVLQVGVAEIAQPEFQPETAGVIARLLNEGHPSVEEALRTADMAGVGMEEVAQEIDAATAQVEPKGDSGGVRKETRLMALAEQESASSDGFRGLLIPEKNEAGEYGDDVVTELSTRLAEMAIDEHLAQRRGYSQSLARIGRDSDLMEGLVERAKLSNDGWLRFGMGLAMGRIESSIRDYPYKEGGVRMPLLLPPGVATESHTFEERRALDEASKTIMHIESLRAEMGYIPSLPNELVSMRHDKRLSFDDIERFSEKMFRRISREELTADEVASFSESFAKASPATQLLIDRTNYDYGADDPRTLLALDKYVSMMDYEAEDLGIAIEWRRKFVKSVSLEDVPIITEDLDEWLSHGVLMRDIQRSVEASGVSEIHDINEVLKGNEVAKTLAMRFASIEPFILTERIASTFRWASMHEPLLNELNKVLSMIEQKTPGILALGYPSDKLRDDIGGALVFADQIGVGNPGDIVRRSLLSAETIGGSYGELQHILGDSGVLLVRDTIESGFSISEGQIDSMISDAASLRDAMSDMGISPRNLVYYASAAPGVSRLQRAEQLMAVAKHLLENGNLEYIMELLDPDKTPSFRRDIARMLFDNDMYEIGEDGSAEAVMAYIDEAIGQIRTLRGDSRFSIINPHLLVKAFLEERGSKCTPTDFGNYLTSSDEINSILYMPNGPKNIEESLWLLRRHYGGYDLASAYKLLQNPAVEGHCGLSHIIMDETQLHGREKVQFYNLAERFLSRLDKDGHPYDSPSTIRHAMQYPGTGRNIDWFAQDASLPLAALPAISNFRAEAIAFGAPDTPRGVYDYLYRDLANIERMSERHLRSEVRKLVGHDAVGRTIDRARHLAERLKGDARICVNMHPETLGMIAQGDGKIKSLFDLDGERVYISPIGKRTASHSGYNLKRSGVEIALGIRSLDEHEEHATYGSMVFITGGIPAGANGYGDIMLSFRIDDDLSARTSYTPEDSFHGANRLTQRDAMALRLLKNACGIGTERTNDYVESQTVGGISLDRLDKIYVKSKDDIPLIPQSLRHLAMVAPRRDDLYDNSKEVEILTGIPRIS